MESEFEDIRSHILIRLNHRFPNEKIRRKIKFDKEFQYTIDRLYGDGRDRVCTLSDACEVWIEADRIATKIFKDYKPGGNLC